MPHSSRFSWVLALCLAACAEGSDGRSTVDPSGPFVDASSPVHVHDASSPPPVREASVEPDASSEPPQDPEACKRLPATVRDFNFSHPDFEHFTGQDAYRGLVAAALGPDGSPSYVPSGGTSVTSGPMQFHDWYHDVPGTNQRVEVTLLLTERQKGLFVYESSAFFPVDGKGFNELHDGHNYAFTTEIHASFQYRGGERFTFRGDDDMWIFVNGKLAVDLGGPHPELEGTVDMDARAAELDLTKGQRYKLDIFHAERHTPGSNFRIETTIDCLVELL